MKFNKYDIDIPKGRHFLPLLGAAIGGSLVSGILGSNENTKNRAFAGEQARAQMAFQRDMAKNAHQYEVEDLKKAGLNPILSAGGGGAATPSGAKADYSPIPPPQIDLPQVFSMAMQQKALAQEQQKIDIQAKTADASIAKNLSDTDLKRLERILKEKMIPRAEIETDLWEEAKGLWDSLKKKGKDALKNSQPGQWRKP